jgi:hypothetical protein
MASLEDNQTLITDISNQNSENYADLPAFFNHFRYPVSLEFSELIAQKAYQEGALDPLGFFHILVNKVYSTIVENHDMSSLDRFLLNERDGFSPKAAQLIKTVKEWECGMSDDTTLAKAIEHFCLNTQSVRLPVISFFLRLMLPNKFGTLDVHAVNALQTLGFKEVKEIPADEQNKTSYFQRYSSLDYLQYNRLLAEIGQHYEISTTKGKRPMFPAEVDMALYMFDKIGKQKKRPDSHNKTAEVMKILEGIAADVYEVSDMEWAKKSGYAGMLRSSAEKLMKIMRAYAQKGDIESMYKYYVNALGDPTGKRVGELLRDCKKRSLESEFTKVKKIYQE